MKKRLTYILILSLMLFTTLGWGSVSVAAEHMTPNMQPGYAG
jgi:hypothetical protein